MAPTKRRKTASSSSSSSSSPPWEWLPDDLWHKIFTHLLLRRLPRHHPYASLRSLSLVCKRFLALSNRTVTFVAVDPGTKPVPLPSLFARFPNITSFRLGPDQDLDASIALLAASDLPLHSLHLSGQTHFPRDAMRLLGRRMCATLKSLSCVRFNGINDDDLALVAACFPYLQQFDIQSHGSLSFVTDRGISEISTKLNSLVSANIINQKRITHRSLQYLASNCPSLRNFGVTGLNMDQLDRFDLFRSLSSLHLIQAKVSQRVLVQLSKFDMKLEYLSLYVPHITSDVTGQMLCRFLKSCRSLGHLVLNHFPFPADTSAIQFAASVPNIRVIRLFSLLSHPIPPATLLYLLKKCPLLEEIHIACSFLGITRDWFNDTSTKCLVRTLDLFFCNDLCDETLKLLVSACPKLEALCLIRCSKITQEGIEAVAASYGNIKFLHARASKNFPYFKLDRRDHVLEQ